MKPAEIAKLDELLNVVTDADLTEAEIRIGDWRLHVSRQRTGQVSLAEGRRAGETAVAEPQEPAAIRAPMVGFFRAPLPPLQPGDPVEEGDVVGAINALGLDNEVRAEIGGVVVVVAARDGAAVQYGQVLYALEPVEVST